MGLSSSELGGGCGCVRKNRGCKSFAQVGKNGMRQRGGWEGGEKGTSSPGESGTSALRLGSSAKLGCWREALQGAARKIAPCQLMDADRKSHGSSFPSHPRVPEDRERGSGKRDGSSLCTTAESWTSIMMVVLSVAFSVLGVMEERSGSLRLTVRLASSSACSLVSRLLQSCSIRLPVFPRGVSGAPCGGLPSSTVPASSASPAGTPFVLWEGGRMKRGGRR